MKGIVFNLFESVVQEEHGEDAWDNLLDAAGVDGVYTSLGNYTDEEFMKLVRAASDAWDNPPLEIVRWFGRKAMPMFFSMDPELFTPHQSTRPFVLTLNDIIHPEVRKIYPGIDVPEFEFDNSSPDVLLMEYRSPRKLCAFAHGLIEGAADHYGEHVTFNQPECMLRGDEKCTFKITFAPGKAVLPELNYE